MYRTKKYMPGFWTALPRSDWVNFHCYPVNYHLRHAPVLNRGRDLCYQFLFSYFVSIRFDSIRFESTKRVLFLLDAIDVTVDGTRLFYSNSTDSVSILLFHRKLMEFSSIATPKTFSLPSISHSVTLGQTVTVVSYSSSVNYLTGLFC